MPGSLGARRTRRARRTVKDAGSRDARSSAHVSGTLTGASGRARVEKAAIEVLVRLFLK
jgi:hypothetical protein